MRYSGGEQNTFWVNNSAAVSAVSEIVNCFVAVMIAEPLVSSKHVNCVK